MTGQVKINDIITIGEGSLQETVKVIKIERGIPITSPNFQNDHESGTIFTIDTQTVLPTQTVAPTLLKLEYTNLTPTEQENTNDTVCKTRSNLAN